MKETVSWGPVCADTLHALLISPTTREEYRKGGILLAREDFNLVTSQLTRNGQAAECFAFCDIPVLIDDALSSGTLLLVDRATLDQFIENRPE